MLRYVILHHQAVAEPHFDLMFETSPGSVLMTWRSPTWPLEATTPVVRLADHRATYLDFEGEISGGRGSVTRMTGGLCEAVSRPCQQVFRLVTGTQIGTMTLLQVDAERWRAFFLIECGVENKKGGVDLSDSTPPREGGLLQ